MKVELKEGFMFHQKALTIVFIFLCFSSCFASPSDTAAEKTVSRYLKIETPSNLPIRIKKTWLYPVSSISPDIQLQFINRSNRPILFLSYDLFETDNRNRVKRLIHKVQFGRESSLWSVFKKDEPTIGPGRSVTLSIPGKFMKNYYLNGKDYGSKAVLFFGYLVFADGSGWEGHGNGSGWTAKKCYFRK